jgi:retron-type reverse transcriptase
MRCEPRRDVRTWPEPAPLVVRRRVRFLRDCVAKLKNEVTAKFRAVPVAPDIWQSNVRQRKKERFTALLHHINIDLLREAFWALKRKATPGVDGLTWPTYEADLDRNLTDLHERVHRGAYRALPSRRAYIPKADGRRRPLAVAALEDKIVQRATAAVLKTRKTSSGSAMGSGQSGVSMMRWTRWSSESAAGE